MNLTNRVQTIELSAGAVTAGTAVNSSTVDTNGFEGCRFIVCCGTSHAGNSVKVQHGATTSPTTDVLGSSKAFDGTDKTVIVDIYRPQERYLRCVITRSGADTTVQSIYAELYGSPRTEPVTQHSSVQYECHVSPAAGTA